MSPEVVVHVIHPRFAADLAGRVGALLDRSSVPARVEAVDGSASGAEVVVGYRLPEDVLARNPGLRLVQLTSVGFDHLPPPLLESTVPITTAGTVPTAAVAEFVMASVLALAKGLPTLVRQHDHRVWGPPAGRSVANDTLVVVGLGRIGQAIARRAASFDMRVVGVRRDVDRPCGGVVEEVYPVKYLRAVAARADHLVVAVPGSPSTQALVDRHVIAALPSHGTVVDVARAGVIDIEAVRARLRDGTLRGAVIDVHDREPLPPDDSSWSTPGLLVTPHCAFGGADETAHLAPVVAESIRRLAAGAPLVHEVDRADRRAVAGWVAPCPR